MRKILDRTPDHILTIRSGDYPFGQVSELTTLAEMQHNCPVFFNIKFGKRETYTIYRGQLIIRYTAQFTGCKPQRMTTVYLFFVDGKMKNDTFCVSAGSGDIKSIPHAKKLINKILDGGIYYYGI